MFQSYNKQVKLAHYHSLGLLKSGAALCFLKAPYKSRQVRMLNLYNYDE